LAVKASIIGVPKGAAVSGHCGANEWGKTVGYSKRGSRRCAAQRTGTVISTDDATGTPDVLGALVITDPVISRTRAGALRRRHHI